MAVSTLAPAAAKTAVKYELGWDGVPLFGTHENALAFDTETSVEPDPAVINRLALLQVSDGTRTVLVHPDDLGRFLDTHRDVPFVCHNAGFDFWVCHEHLRMVGLDAQARGLWEKVDRGLIHDSMILDALVRLAEGKGETGEDGDKFYMRGLGDVAREYAGITLDKADPYRMRYGEIIGKRFSEVTEKGFWTYAAKDAFATAHTWPSLYRRALALAQRFAFGVGREGSKRLARWLDFGPLTELVQVQGAIALSAIERIGLPYDPDAARADEARWRPVVEECVLAIDELRPGFFKKKNGRFELAKKSKVPGIIQGDLLVALDAAALKIKEAVPEFQIPQSTGKKFQETGDAMSRSAEDWSPYAGYDSFLEHWVRLSDVTKRLGFYSNFADPPRTLFSDLEPEPDRRIRSRINLLMRTGRTSYQNPNAQQFPRDPDFRRIFQARPGKKLLTIDYSFIELRTLAATCLDRFGYSVLAEVIKKGVDPHAYTAAILQGLTLDAFLGLKKTDPAKFKTDRQSAKALNFGIPGGLGSTKLVAYAAANYGVRLSAQDAEAFRRKIITEVYPELNDKDGYLADDTYGAIALNTGLSRGEVLVALPGNDSMRPWLGRVLSRIAGGATNKATGDPYDADFFEDCWDFLEGIGRKAPLGGPLSTSARDRLKARVGTPSLSRELTLAHAVTLTGRIRSKVRFTVSKNTPFQGLAADGIKLAAYRLARDGWSVCALVHDELVVEISDRGEVENEKQGREVERVMNTAMEDVLGGAVPSGAEWHVSDFWTK